MNHLLPDKFKQRSKIDIKEFIRMWYDGKKYMSIMRQFNISKPTVIRYKRMLKLPDRRLPIKLRINPSKCIHCNKNAGQNRRGLCMKCHGNITIRNNYPIANIQVYGYNARYGRRGV
jgi:hypothetical protein